MALFRYGLIADVLRLPPGSREIRRALHEKAQRSYVIPGHAAHPRRRRDHARLAEPVSHRRVRGAVSEDPRRPRPAPAPAPRGRRSARLTQNRAARTVGQSPHQSRPRTRHRPPRSPPRPCTGLLAREGLLDARPGDPVATDRRRFAFRDAGELWMSDVMHGPKVADGRRRRKTFLIAFIDDATRRPPLRRLRLLGEHHRVPVLHTPPCTCMLSPLPRRNRMGAHVVRFPFRRRPSPYPGGIGFRVRCFRGLLGVHCALRPACSLSPFGPFCRNASIASLPPQPSRLLPAGTTLAGRELHPLRVCAFARHTKMPRAPRTPRAKLAQL